MNIKTVDPAGINLDLREYLEEGKSVVIVEKTGDIMKILGKLSWTSEEFVLDENYLG